VRSEVEQQVTLVATRWVAMVCLALSLEHLLATRRRTSLNTRKMVMAATDLDIVPRRQQFFLDGVCILYFHKYQGMMGLDMSKGAISTK